MDDVRPIPATQDQADPGPDSPAETPPYFEPIPGFGPNWVAFKSWLDWDALPESERPYVAPGDNPAGLPILPLPPRPMSEPMRRYLEENREAIEACNAWDEQNETLFDDIFGDPFDLSD